jgi:hypothetical protein
MLAQSPYILFINQLNRCVVIIMIVFVVSLTGHCTGHGLTACTGRAHVFIRLDQYWSISSLYFTRSWGWRLILWYDNHVDLLNFPTFRRNVVFAVFNGRTSFNFHVGRLWKLVSYPEEWGRLFFRKVGKCLWTTVYVPEDGYYNDVFLVFGISRRYKSTRDAYRLSSIWCDGWSICFETYWADWLIEHAYELCQLMSRRCTNCCFGEGWVWKWRQSTF